MLKHSVGSTYHSNCLRSIATTAIKTSRSIDHWTEDDWYQALTLRGTGTARQWLAALAFRRYGVNLSRYFHRDSARNHNSYALALKFFGQTRVDAVCDRILKTLEDIGYRHTKANQEAIRGNICEILTLSGKCSIKELTVDRIKSLKHHGVAHKRVKYGHALSVALHQLGLVDAPIYLSTMGGPNVTNYRGAYTVTAEWHSWVERWRNTTTREESTIRTRYSALLTAGRWLKAVHPEILTPAQWTGEIAAEYARAVHDMKVGDFMEAVPQNIRHVAGQPMAPKSKEFRLSVLRCFFRDLEDWGWLKLTFNPDRVLRSSFTVRLQIRPDPAPIDNHIWAKLIWAGLNLTPERFYESGARGGMYRYPFEYIRAVTMIWLFSGLRRNEIRRLTVDCVRRDLEPAFVDLLADNVAATPDICYLTVPVGKRKKAFEKPVDAVIADAIEAWLRIRPVQAAAIDRKTKKAVHFLLTYRGKQIGESYINNTLIERLCKIAGVPRSDSKGKITSHRARHTMATLLANQKNPMSLYQLAEWLGHDSVESSMQYVHTPLVELTSAFKRADYFRSNIRTIEVLLDRSVIAKGSANSDRPYKYYNLGPVGYCANEFWSQCEHRMACIKCPFHVPRDDARLALLETKCDLSRMLEEVALTDAEQRELANDIDELDAAISNCRVDPITPQSDVPDPKVVHSSEQRDPHGRPYEKTAEAEPSSSEKSS